MKSLTRRGGDIGVKGDENEDSVLSAVTEVRNSSVIVDDKDGATVVEDVIVAVAGKKNAMSGKVRTTANKCNVWSVNM